MITVLKNVNEDDKARIRAMVESCWTPLGRCRIWTGKLNSGGYGEFKWGAVHRLAYAVLVSDFPVSNYICHRCDTTACINPDHLYVGDAKTNARDASIRGRIRGNRSLYPKS